MAFSRMRVLCSLGQKWQMVSNKSLASEVFYFFQFPAAKDEMNDKLMNHPIQGNT